MKRFVSSEKLLVEELAEIAKNTKEMSKGLNIGALIRMIRLQLGMSQAVLSRRANILQSTISRIENGGKDLNLSSLNKILKALSCDLVIVPLLLEPIDTIRRRQAKKQAKRRIDYLKGTMGLEKQEPDEKLVKELLLQEENRLLHGGGSELWNEE